MNIKELKEKLTIDNIITLMEEFGAEPRVGRSDNEIVFRTICHGGDSHKLYFYKSNMNFHCYTNCGSMDIIQIVQNVMGLELPRAIRYICERFGFDSDFHYGFGTNEEYVDEWECVNQFKRKEVTQETWTDFKVIDDKIFNIFYPFYHPNFLNDGISKRAMDKFEIQYDIYNDRIIIPHRYTTGDLVAIRCRNLDEHLVETGRKYMPIMVDNKILSAPTSQYLYGLYQNIDNIKDLKKVVLVESEKAVLQYETMYPNNNIAVALSSSNLSTWQVDILKSLGVEEVIIALDKEFDTTGTREEMLYAMKIDKSLMNKLGLFDVSVIWDYQGLLDKKDSPLDKGKEVFEKLYQGRIFKHRWENILDEIYRKRKQKY